MHPYIQQAEISGTITAFCVENGSTVLPGQAIVTIKP
jgi:biotin carboxyl carrier protein